MANDYRFDLPRNLPDRDRPGGVVTALADRSDSASRSVWPDGEDSCDRGRGPDCDPAPAATGRTRHTSEAEMNEPLLSLEGAVSWFGGPEDDGVSSDEGLAVIYEYEDAPHLFLDEQPPGTSGLAR